MIRWLIPAHAGKTTPPPEAREPLWAHPRSRGENLYGPLVGRCATGSSPLTRGKRSPTRLGLRGGGLIPAHAGKTTQAARSRSASWAHPRSRGENLPRSRPSAISQRLIPAHAGKTTPDRPSPSA